MKIASYLLAAAIVALQYPLWLGDGGVTHLWRLERQIEQQKTENAHLRDRNASLTAEVIDLKTGLEAIEERARAELGMVKRGERFFQVIEER